MIKAHRIVTQQVEGIEVDKYNMYKRFSENKCNNACVKLSFAKMLYCQMFLE